MLGTTGVTGSEEGAGVGLGPLPKGVRPELAGGISPVLDQFHRLRLECGFILVILCPIPNKFLEIPFNRIAPDVGPGRAQQSSGHKFSQRSRCLFQPRADLFECRAKPLTIQFRSTFPDVTQPGEGEFIPDLRQVLEGRSWVPRRQNQRVPAIVIAGVSHGFIAGSHRRPQGVRQE
jgi:hypothetical protein